MSECVDLTGEQEDRLLLFRKIEQLLDGGFTGQIILHCAQGKVPRYSIEQTKKVRD